MSTIYEVLRAKLGREPTRDELREDCERIIGRTTSPGGLEIDSLYLGDNGRCFCGRLRCAGTTAYLTGRDLSGQRVLKLPPARARKHKVKCEMCGHDGGERKAVAT